MTSGNKVNISTSELRIILRDISQTLVFKGPKHRKHLNDYMQQRAFNRSINNSNIGFRKKKILLVTDEKTNNLKSKTTPRTKKDWNNNG